MVFWIICHRKAKKGHAIDELVIIKLFGSNYARDLLDILTKRSYDDDDKDIIIAIDSSGIKVTNRGQWMQQ